MARCYALAARKSEESYPKSQTVALIVVITDNLFTLFFLPGEISVFILEQGHSDYGAHS